MANIVFNKSNKSYNPSFVEKVDKKEGNDKCLLVDVSEKPKTKLSFVDKSKEKPQRPQRPIQILEKPKVVEKPSIPVKKIKICPFDEGDLVKFKDNIYLIIRNLDGDMYLHTDTMLSMKKIKPDNWGIFRKIH